MNADQSNPQPNLIPCACVHHDARECARIRDRRLDDIDHESPDHGRLCECSCHKDYDDMYDDDDF